MGLGWRESARARRAGQHARTDGADHPQRRPRPRPDHADGVRDDGADGDRDHDDDRAGAGAGSTRRSACAPSAIDGGGGGDATSGVLVPVALSASGPHLLDLALALARGDAAAHLRAARQPAARARHARRQPAGEGELGGALAPLLAHARAAAIDVRPLARHQPQPADEICEVARAERRRARSSWAGTSRCSRARCSAARSIASCVTARADVAVLIDKQMPDPPRAILLPYTGTPHDRLALRLAARLAHRCRRRR